MSTKTQVSTERKNPLRGRVLVVTAAKEEKLEKSLKNRFYACQFSHKTRKDAMATAIEGRTHKKHSLILKLHRIIISFLLFTARSTKV